MTQRKPITPSIQPAVSPCRSIRLPPEVVEQIFHYIKIALPDLDAAFDLIAVSMVCAEWYMVARPMITDTVFKSLEEMEANKSRPYGDDIRRLAALLSTAHELGLPYCAAVKNLRIRMAHHLDRVLDTCLAKYKFRLNYKGRGQDENASLFKILQITKLDKLTISNTVLPRRNRIPGFFGECTRFLFSLKKYISDIPELELHIFSKHSDYNPFLLSVVQVVQGSLTSVILDHDPNDPTVQSFLSRCPKLRVARFHQCKIQTADQILRGSHRSLRQVELHNLQGPNEDLGDLLTGLHLASKNLESLEIVSVPSSAQNGAAIRTPTDIALALALETLIYSTTRLKRLRLEGSAYLDDDVLWTVIERGQNLEYLALSGCWLTGSNIRLGVTPTLSVLQCLMLGEGGFVLDFVEWVTACEGIEALGLNSRMGRMQSVRRILENCGFRGVKPSMWHRRG